MSPHKLLQGKVTAFEQAVRHGDTATALTLLGDVAREAEARGVARCAAVLRDRRDDRGRFAASDGRGAAVALANELADLFDSWAGTTRQAPAPQPEPAAPEPAAESVFGEGGDTPEGEPAPGSEPESEAGEEPAPRRRKGRSHE